MTVLGVAAYQGNLKAVKSLLGEDVNENFCSVQRPSSLDFATKKAKAENNGYFIICRDIEENELEGPTPEGMEELEWDNEVMMGNDKDRDVPTPPEAKIYKYYADVLNRTAVTLQSPNDDLTRLDYHGMSPLHYAVQQVLYN